MYVDENRFWYVVAILIVAVLIAGALENPL